MNFTINVSQQEADYLLNVLAQRPWGEVNQLLSNLTGQLQQQQRQAAPGAPGQAPMLNGGGVQ